MKAIILSRPSYKGGEMIAAESSVIESVMNDSEIPKADLTFRWACTSTTPSGTKHVNKASAIHRVYDKAAFRKALFGEDLSMETYTDFGDFLENSETSENDWIVRPKEHYRSQNLFVCPTAAYIYRALIKPCMSDGYYISKLIHKKAEYRVFVVSGRVIAVIRKIPADPTAVSWGCVTEGEFEYIPWSEWPIDVCENAVKSTALSGLDFGAVDIITDDQRAYCLEINTGPQITPYYAKCFAKAFDYIVEKGRDLIPVTGDTWKHYIHPAISSEAK